MKSVFYKLIILWILYLIRVLPSPTSAKSNVQRERIINGRAAIGQFPWHVLFKLHDYDNEICGGSVIHEIWVLTAARCVRYRDSVLMAFGTIELSGSSINMTSKNIFIHPEYDPALAQNDIALIELPSPLIFSKHIQAIELISLHESFQHTFFHIPTYFCGFGQYEDDNSKNSPWLLWATIQIVNNTVCEEFYTEMTLDQMCGNGYKGNKQHPCIGDYGGALIWNNMNKIKQIGILSFSYPLTCAEYPFGFTKISSYLYFIYKHTGINPE